MSHYAKVKVVFKTSDEGSLVAALKTMFSDVEVHAEPVVLNNYGERPGTNKANVVVRQKVLRAAGGGLTNDLGFARNADGTYTAYIDEAGFNKNQLQTLNKEYSTNVAVSKLQTQGYKVTRTNNKDGTVDVKAVIYA